MFASHGHNASEEKKKMKNKYRAHGSERLPKKANQFNFFACSGASWVRAYVARVLLSNSLGLAPMKLYAPPPEKMCLAIFEFSYSALVPFAPFTADACHICDGAIHNTSVGPHILDVIPTFAKHSFSKCSGSCVQKKRKLLRTTTPTLAMPPTTRRE